MPAERRRTVDQPDELAALAHPLRLDLLTFLMSAGPATASACARAVGDSPSNCSYHLRFLARHGLVEPIDNEDGRERPWRATITGLDVDPGSAGAEQEAAFAAVALQRDQRLAREFLTRRAGLDAAWRTVSGLSTYTLKLTPDEAAELLGRLDALIRPYIAAVRDDDPAGAALVHLGLQSFPLEQP